MLINHDIYNIPVSGETMPEDIAYCVKSIEEDDSLRLVRVEHYSYGTPDGDDITDSWQVISYHPSTERFFITDFMIWYECDEKKVRRDSVTLDGAVVSKLWDKCKDMEVA
jgi:hypothetical protein